MKKTIFLNISLLAASIVLSLVMLETAVRIFLPRYKPTGNLIILTSPDKPPLYQKSTRVRLNNYCDFDVEVRANQYGLRDKKDLKDSTKNDIFVVGDSYSAGFGVEEEKRYSNLLEKKLGVPVYNIAVVGDFEAYGELIKYAKSHGANIKNLIVGVCMDNDILYYKDTLDRYNALYHKKKTNNIIRCIKDFIRGKSALYNLTAHCIKRNRFLTRIFGLNPRENAVEYVQRSKYDSELIDQSVNKLEEITQGYNVIILVIPSHASYIFKDKELRLHEKFVAELRKRGFTVVDMYDYYNVSDAPIYHLRFDGHWNDKGHDIGARALYETVKKSSFLEKIKR